MKTIEMNHTLDDEDGDGVLTIKASSRHYGVDVALTNMMGETVYAVFTQHQLGRFLKAADKRVDEVMEYHL